MNIGYVHRGVGPEMLLIDKCGANAGRSDKNLIFYDHDNCTVLVLIAMCKYNYCLFWYIDHKKICRLDGRKKPP